MSNTQKELTINNKNDSINKVNSRNYTKSKNLPSSQKSTIDGTPTKEVKDDSINEIEIKSNSSSMSHISKLLSNKKLTYSQIYNKVPYHSSENNFVYNMMSRNSRIEKVNELMSNMKHSFEMIKKNSLTATTGYTNSNNHSKVSVKVTCCFFSSK